MATSSEKSSDDKTSLDLNEFTVSKFINLMLDYYKKDYPTPLNLKFYGHCEFEFVLDFYMFIKLKNKHLPTVNLLRNYPELFVYSNFTYGFNCRTKGGFRIIQEVWKLHAGFRKIEILDYNVTLQRLAPKSLTLLCLRVVDMRSFDKLPEHVSKKLKEVENFDEYELSEELDEVIDYKSIARENFLRRMRNREGVGLREAMGIRTGSAGYFRHSR